MTVLPPTRALRKVASGIDGLDEITGGGLPAGRPTLLCGAAGCGKTLFAMTFLVEGIRRYGENGVFMCFEETEAELADNVASLGHNLDALVAANTLAVDYVRIDRSEIEETGEYDLDGLFVRLAYAIQTVGAKRVVLDTLEVLFGGLSNQAVLRSELRRLFRWLKDQGVTAVITAERGDGALTRHGLEEYVSDCVILLDHRVIDQVATRRLRVIKYRGTSHGTNEYPFLIDEQGISVLPVTSVHLNHPVSEQRVSTGIAGLDGMLGAKGFYRGSSVLVSGVAGSGKTTVAAHFVDAACRRGERALYFAFEESPQQIIRNMRSVGLDLEAWVSADLLRFSAARASLCGLEMHLARMHMGIVRFDPAVVVVDPLFTAAAGVASEVRAMLLRLIDSLKGRGITALFTTLDTSDHSDAMENAHVTSLIDSWVQLRVIESSGERNRALFVLKSRGMPHSRQVREFLLSDQGVHLREVYLGRGGVLTGSARLAQEALDAEREAERQQVAAVKRRDMERKRRHLESQIAALQAEMDAQDSELQLCLAQRRSETEILAEVHRQLAKSREDGETLP